MNTATAPPSPKGKPHPHPRVGGGFGLDLEGAFYAPGLLTGRVSGSGRRTVVELASAREIKSEWNGRPATRVSEWRFPDGRVGLIYEVSELGYHVYGRGFGRYLLSPDGTWVRCAPARIAAWRWQRFLVGQVLPFAAVLQGLEVIHASAVAVGDRAVALTGPTGSGKSSLALNLLLRGAAFVCDDVLALETHDGGVVGHPGPGLASVRLAEPAVPAADRHRLGRVIGQTDHELRLGVEAAEGAMPVAAVCFLERHTDGPLVEPIADLDPRPLLASTFNFVVRTPERLARQLDVMARLSRTARLLRARVVPGMAAAGLAEAIHSYLAADPGR